MKLHYWQYFVALEADLAHTARFVEPEEANMSCHSIEFARLLLAAGSEVDVLCKVLCKSNGLVPTPEDINGYRVSITSKFPGFTDLQIMIPRYSLTRLPWQAWVNDITPDWWHAYNGVKHERHSAFKKANLANTLDAMAGLFVLVCYVCHDELRSRKASPWPQMLSLDPTLSADISRNHVPGHVLPDYKE